MSKHTPGPWNYRAWGQAVEIRADHPTDPTGGLAWINGRADMDKGIPSRQNIANARLIAAAPDLLSALKEVVRISERHHVAWDAAHVAIAKAEGKHG